MEQEIVKQNVINFMGILESIYVMFHKKSIFAKKNVIIIVNLYKLIMKKLNAMNFVYFLLDIKESIFVSNHIIIFVIKNVFFLENQMDVMKIVPYNMSMKEIIYVLLKKIYILVNKNANCVKTSVGMLIVMIFPMI